MKSKIPILELNVDLYNVIYDEQAEKVQSLFKEVGYEVPLWFAQSIWEYRSQQDSAGWLILPKTGRELMVQLSEFFDLK